LPFGFRQILKFMPICDQPTRVLIKDMIAALAPQKGVVFSKDAAIDWFGQHYPNIKEGTISAHLVRFSTNSPSRLHHSIRPDEDMLYQVDRSNFRLFDPPSDPPAIHSESDIKGKATGGKGPTEKDESCEFAYESDLRDFLVKNLRLIEPGLVLYQEEGIRGIEFPVGGRFIDILAVDANDALVVIELKVSRGYDRVVGQILRYMAWIEKHQAKTGQTVRGIIAAREISEDLKLACSTLPAVALYEYELSVTLRKLT
jgi:hypothetical protein